MHIRCDIGKILTCTADGYTTYFCACGATNVVDVKPATGHVSADYRNGVLLPVYTCDNCGVVLAEGFVVATVNGKYFATLVEAVDAARDGDTVELLRSVAGVGIVINKSITVDFGGYTYTVNGNTVGSTGTQTLGFQILVGNDVTLMNGAIATNFDGCLMLIQNYLWIRIL